MTEDDIKSALRELKEFIAAQFEVVNYRVDNLEKAVGSLERRVESIEHHISEMESGWMNWARDFGRRQNILEERFQALEAKVALLEGRM